MNKFILLAFSLASLAFPKLKIEADVNQQNATVTTYYLIRHAEKDDSQVGEKDPQLSQEGILRSERWAQFFKDVKLDDIYSTQFKRTTATAMPVAADKQLQVKTYNPFQLYDNQFKEATKGKTVLVVGHSNTTPALANKILGEEKYLALEEAEYSMLYIVTVNANGETFSEVKKLD